MALVPRKAAAVFLVCCLLVAMTGALTARASVSVTQVSASPASVATAASYTFQFITSHGLAGQNAYMRFDFPQEYTIPATIALANVSVSAGQGANPILSTVTASAGQQNTTVLVVTFTSINVAINQPVTITFAVQAGIINPGAAGSYAIGISTSQDNGTGTGSVTIGGGGGTTGTTATVRVVLDPSGSGKAGQYAIDFDLPQNGALIGAQGDYVDIVFPEGTRVPASFEVGSILMKLQYVSAQVSGNRLRLFVPEQSFVAGGAQCNVLITTAAQILNPEQPGVYTLQAATSKGFAGVSSGYQVTGTTVSGASVVTSPTQQGMTAQYDIAFTISQAGALKANVDRIYLQFPSEVRLPATVAPAFIRVNGTPATVAVYAATGKMAVTLPVDIAGGSIVRMALAAGLGVRNPLAIGTYRIAVSTSQDTAQVNASFTITASQVTAATVSLSNPGAAQATSYTVTFSTGAGGALTAGIDKINLEFPLGTTIPSSISGNAVTVNGLTTPLATPSGTVVSVVVPASVPVSGPVTVVFLESAGLRNPVSTGTFVMRVSTTRESTPIASAGYVISALPTVTATVSPPAADGRAGYYRTRPSIIFTASSPVDATPTVYYRFDSNQYAVYGGSAVLGLEGQHTINYYAMDRQGRQSIVGSLSMLVDSVAPVLGITSPADGAVLTSRTVDVAGTTDVGSSVTVNGQSVLVAAGGAFSTTLTLSGDAGSVVLQAIDVAGNVTERTIAVSFDTTPPALSLISPGMFEKVYRLPLQVAGRSESGVTVVVNGVPATVAADGSWTVSLATLADGANAISATARDLAGNSTTRTVSISFLKTTLIRMQLGTTVALVNSTPVTLSVAPFTTNGFTLVPLRFLAETFGITPQWDGVFRIIDMTVGSHQVRLQVGARYAGIDGKRVALDVAPTITSGVTMVPLRFVAETLGADVLWDAGTKTITIIYPKGS
jgi:hypothetical protein